MEYLKDLSKIEKGQLILLFTADWCGDCIVLNMYIDDIVAENPAYEFVKINSDDHPLLAREYNIYGIPSFVALRDGEVIGEYIDKEAKPKDKIQSWLDNLPK